MFNNKPTREQVEDLEKKNTIMTLALFDLRTDLQRAVRKFDDVTSRYTSLVRYLSIEYVQPVATLPSYQKIKKEKK
jgi:hypothetical protein